MTLTLDIPPEAEAAKLIKAAVALYDAPLLSQGQAAEMAGLSRAGFIAPSAGRALQSSSTTAWKNCWRRRA